MYNIVIGIPTYKRPLMLQKLIFSIRDSYINSSLINHVNIIVIDNDIDKTAEKTVTELVNGFDGIYKLNYYSYPVKGLSNVRNELFKKALEFKPDYIVSIDDDEYPSSDWLNQMSLTITSIKSEIVLGPVIPVFENKVSPYISYWFKYKVLENCQKVDFFWSGNFIISTDFLLSSKIRFDKRFNSTGSEDSYFGVKALNRGAGIYWASNAIVYETIPAKRARLKWLIKRSYNGAITFTRILKLEKKYFELLKKALISFVYFFSGSIALVFVVLPFRWKYWGLLKLSESIGACAGLVGIKFHEYARDR
jgi:succinoglycan biosynthesis protein ExoM